MMTPRPTPILAALILLFGCGAAHYSYPLYTPKSLPYGKVFPLRVAIPYPEEGTTAPNRDADIEPIVTSRCPQATYISPRLEISRGLLEELRATEAFRVIHWAPSRKASCREKFLAIFPTPSSASSWHKV
jgi:hypothetical protein